MSTTPEATERKIVAKETEVERVKKQLEDAIGDRDRELLLRQELAALQQQLAALQQQLAALQQEKVLLMQQQAAPAAAAPAAAAAGGAVSLEQIVDAIDKKLEPLKQLVVAAYNNQHWAPASSTSTVRQRFRTEAFTAYGAFNDTNSETWCVVTGMWWPATAAKGVSYVRNAHIFSRKDPESDWLDMQLGCSRDVLENVVPMMASVEVAFDTQRMCVLPTKDDQSGAVSFVIHILDPELMDKKVYADFCGRYKREHAEWTPPLSGPQERVGLGAVQATALTFGQLDRQPLVFRGEQRPAKRCFTYHAFWAVGRAKELGTWNTEGLDISVDHFGWQSPTMEAQMRKTAVWAAMQQQQPRQEADSGSGEGSVETEADGLQQGVPGAV